MILLDTNIVVAYFNGDRRVVARLLDKLPAIALPAPVVAELDFGAKASQNKKKILRHWMSLSVWFLFCLLILMPRENWGVSRANFDKLVSQPVRLMP